MFSVSKDGNISLNQLWENADEEKRAYKSSQMMEQLETLPPEVFESALRFVSGLKDLPVEHMEQINLRIKKEFKV